MGTMEIAAWVSIGLFLVLGAVGALIAAKAMRKRHGTVAAQVEIWPNVPFEVPLAPRASGSYQVQLRLGYFMPSRGRTDVREPTVRLEVHGQAGVLLSGDYRRSTGGLDEDARSSRRADGTAYESSRTLVDLPTAASAGGIIRGVLGGDMSPQMRVWLVVRARG